MPGLKSYWSYLPTTIQSVLSKLSLGVGGPLISNESGEIAFRDAADSAYAPVKVGTAVIDQDALNLGTANGLYGSSGTFQLSGTTTSVTATQTIPANAIVTSTELTIIAADSGATVNIGTTGTANMFVSGANVTAIAWNPYAGPAIAVGVSAVTPKVTIAGATTLQWSAVIHYSVPRA